MKIIAQQLKLSEYNHSLFLYKKELEFDENAIVCLMITKKDYVTKNEVNFSNVEMKQIHDKTAIAYKDFKLFFEDGTYVNFSLYNYNDIDNTLKKLKKITNSVKPIIFDNFLEQSPLVFNSDNYCYIKKEYIKKTTIRQGHKDLGDEFFTENPDNLILAQQIPNQINFNILELDIGKRKIKLNMYMKKTLEYNELYTPGLVSIKQKIKRML